MLLEKDIKKLFQQLLIDQQVHFIVDGTDVNIRIFDHASKLSLSAPVYHGGNYIPKSVRSSLSKKMPFSTQYEHIRTYLTVDEDNFRVFLNYLDRLDHLNNESFRMLLEEFSWIANEWRLHLDEDDKQDLVHIFVK